MKRAFIKGNDAVICGALCAGCRAFFGYPITPASEIAHDAMSQFPKAGALAIQAESEVAAINMLYGAGACGSAAMTATSGPGFSLMQEGISYMAAARLPGVIVDIMRSGPGLGNIGPEQADYYMAVKGGGHGHYHCIVLAPASVQEMFSMTRLAFELSFKYRTPAIVLADAFIGQMMETVSLPDDLPGFDEIPQNRFPFENAVDGTPETMGHVVSSLQLVPQKLHIRNDSRFQDYQAIVDDLQSDAAEMSPDLNNDPEKIDTLVVAFGICARIAADAVRIHCEQGHHTSLFRPKFLWPFPERALLEAAGHASRVIVVECSRGMMREDVERILGRSRVQGIYSDGGVIPTSTEILDVLNCTQRSSGC